MYMKTIRFTMACFIGCLVVKTVFAATLVRIELQQGAAPAETVNLKLYDDVAPLTISNFLNYANSTTSSGGDYTHSFIHRSIPGFIVQGGGYTFDPWLNDGTFSFDMISGLFLGGLQELLEDSPIANEYNKSNVTGTIAMALRGGDVNSATSQWFINLGDNSASLDPQSFTVFGEVLGDGMDVFNSIAAQPIYDNYDIHPVLAALPLVGYTSGEPVIQANLIQQTSITELLSITSDIDFSLLVTGTSAVESVITVTNLMANNLSIGNIADTDGLSSPFSIVVGSDSCSGMDVPALGSCNLTVKFVPEITNVFRDAFNIEFTNLSLSYSFSLTGIGPKIRPNFPIVDFGEQQVYVSGSPGQTESYTEQIVLYIYNDGNANLNISSVTLEGVNATDFEFYDNCTQYGGPVIAPGGFCVLPINLISSTAGNKVATLTVVSDDADESVLVIPITATVSLDLDGVSELIEDASPNAGDGNNDDVQDRIQSNVASMPAPGGEYVTLETDSYINIRAASVSILSNSQLEMIPVNTFDLGVLDFKLEGVSSSSFYVGLILPEGMVPSSYYMYGPTPENTNDHWYEFTLDATTGTGAQILGNISIPSPTGNIIRSAIMLWFKDGERGDSDLIVNGSIMSSGGADFSPLSNSSGGLAVLEIYLFLLTISACRFYGRNKAVPWI